jgi:triacylglycerol esterase/lipase EstA (alpha/beta hydrolase family)
MGGIAARLYLAEHGAGRVAGLVTIASPHAGTILARLAPGANARQMERGSAFLAALAAREAGCAPCDATSIYSPHDNLVWPHETSRLAWARSVALPGLGHVAILSAPSTHRILLEAIQRARSGAARG